MVSRIYVTGPAGCLKTSAIKAYNSSRTVRKDGHFPPKMVPGFYTDYSEDVERSKVWMNKQNNPNVNLVYCAMKSCEMAKDGVFDRFWMDAALYNWVFESTKTDKENLVFDEEFILAIKDGLMTALNTGEKSIAEKSLRFSNTIILMVLPVIKNQEDFEKYIKVLELRHNGIDILELWYLTRQLAAFRNFHKICMELGLTVDFLRYDLDQKSKTVDLLVRYLDDTQTPSMLRREMDNSKIFEEIYGDFVLKE